jgi:import receptor subunit TOM20
MASLTEPSGLRPATIIGITASTILTGVIAYAVYFDYKRRNDAEFRKALKRDSKRSAKQAKLEAEASTKARRNEIRALVEQVNNENLPSDAEGHEQFFMEEVSKGEQLLQDESKSMEAALCFFRALKVYPTPEELINIYDKTVPKVWFCCWLVGI